MKQPRWQSFRQATLFLTTASLLVFAPLALQHQEELHRREQAYLLERIGEMRRAYTQTLRELGLVQEQSGYLQEQLQDREAELEFLERLNSELEQILFNQRETYQNAVSREGPRMEILTPSCFTAKMYERAWARLGAHGLKGTGEDLVRAEETHGVNSLVLAAIAYFESGGGMSALARDKNNLFGLGAGGANPYTSARSFESRRDCIFYTAHLLQNSYLDRHGRFYNGNNLYAVGVRYAGDPLWPEKVGEAMARIACAAIPEGR